MKKLIILTCLLANQGFAQEKSFELRISGGHNTFFSSPFVKYPSESPKITLSPLVNVSFYFNATKSTLFGLEAQYEWLKKKSAVGKVTDQYGAVLRDAYSIQRKNIASFGIGGRTYVIKKALYLGYGYRFAVTNTNTNELDGFVKTTITYQQETYHVPNFSIGVKFSDKWAVSPFMEINPAVYIGSKDAYSSVQLKAGVVF